VEMSLTVTKIETDGAASQSVITIHCRSGAQTAAVGFVVMSER
jgi:hypothetical protein